MSTVERMGIVERLPEALGSGDLRLVRVRPDTGRDLLDPLFEALAPEVWQHIPGGRPTDADDFAARLMARVTTPEPAASWIVLLDARPVGSSSHIPLIGTDAHPAGIEIGATFMAPTTWGTGLNTRVKALMIDAAQHAGARFVRFRTDERNLRSAAAIRKLGARPVGTRLEDIVRADGSVRTSLLFRLDLRDS